MLVTHVASSVKNMLDYIIVKQDDKAKVCNIEVIPNKNVYQGINCQYLSLLHSLIVHIAVTDTVVEENGNDNAVAGSSENDTVQTKKPKVIHYQPRCSIN